jgi:hypothetical protein
MKRVCELFNAARAVEELLEGAAADGSSPAPECGPSQVTLGAMLLCTVVVHLSPLASSWPSQVTLGAMLLCTVGAPLTACQQLAVPGDLERCVHSGSAPLTACQQLVLRVVVTSSTSRKVGFMVAAKI